jgi:hypothetical protein
MDAEKLKAKVLRYVEKRENGCWEWQGSLVHGYGQTRVGDKVMGAHRLAYLLWNGEIPRGHVVRHNCDNTICCNPEHLAVGTHEDNNADIILRGRVNNAGGKWKGDHARRTGNPIGRPKGSKNLRPRIPIETCHEIVRLYLAGGVTQKQLAERFNCDQTYVSLLVKAAMK